MLCVPPADVPAAIRQAMLLLVTQWYEHRQVTGTGTALPFAVEALLAPRKPVFEAAEHPAMHPGRCARIVLDGIAVGFVGELHPKWRQSWGLSQAPVLFELELDVVLSKAILRGDRLRYYVDLIDAPDTPALPAPAPAGDGSI